MTCGHSDHSSIYCITSSKLLKLRYNRNRWTSTCSQFVICNVTSVCSEDRTTTYNILPWSTTAKGSKLVKGDSFHKLQAENSYERTLIVTINHSWFKYRKPTLTTMRYLMLNVMRVLMLLAVPTFQSLILE